MKPFNFFLYFSIKYFQLLAGNRVIHLSRVSFTVQLHHYTRPNLLQQRRPWDLSHYLLLKSLTAGAVVLLDFLQEFQPVVCFNWLFFLCAKYFKVIQ